jgi:hypothetical protein
VPSDSVHFDGSISSFTIGETFALGSRISFGSLDFLATVTCELRLPTPMRLPLRSQEDLHALLLGARWRSDASKGVSLPSSDVLTSSLSASSKRQREPHLQRSCPSSTTSQLRPTRAMAQLRCPTLTPLRRWELPASWQRFRGTRMVVMRQEDEKHPLLGAQMASFFIHVQICYNI